MSHDRGCWKCGRDGLGEKAACALANGMRCVKWAVFFRNTTAVLPGEARFFLDMDGVLADFGAHYEAIFGQPRELHSGWDNIRKAHPRFYRDMPPMPDMEVLWSAVKHLRPIILTGTPPTVNSAANDKVEWKNNHPLLGEKVGIICCRTRDKSLYCRPGDVIVDDSPEPENRQMWEKAGGVWVPHKDAKTTILHLRLLGILP